jgi:uncharacterized protein (DUF433 family)
LPSTTAPYTIFLNSVPKADAKRLDRQLNPNERIEIDPAVMLGKPVIKGTRIPVELILRKLGEGATERDLLDAYPNLIVTDIRAAMTYTLPCVTRGQALASGA